MKRVRVIHSVKDIVTSETECGLRSKFGKYMIAFKDSLVTCKKCKKKMETNKKQGL
jgi:hypothetical protein